MTLDQLKYFVLTARFEHIGKAAKILRLNPSTLSHAIKKLEDELTVELFEKNGNSIRLTGHGKALQGQAEDLLNSANRIKQDFVSRGKETSPTPSPHLQTETNRPGSAPSIVGSPPVQRVTEY